MAEKIHERADRVRLNKKAQLEIALEKGKNEEKTVPEWIYKKLTDLKF